MTIQKKSLSCLFKSRGSLNFFMYTLKILSTYLRICLRKLLENLESKDLVMGEGMVMEEEMEAVLAVASGSTISFRLLIEEVYCLDVGEEGEVKQVEPGTVWHFDFWKKISSLSIFGAPALFALFASDFTEIFWETSEKFLPVWSSAEGHNLWQSLNKVIVHAFSF